MLVSFFFSALRLDILVSQIRKTKKLLCDTKDRINLGVFFSSRAMYYMCAIYNVWSYYVQFCIYITNYTIYIPDALLLGVWIIEQRQTSGENIFKFTQPTQILPTAVLHISKCVIGVHFICFVYGGLHYIVVLDANITGAYYVLYVNGVWWKYSQALVQHHQPGEQRISLYRRG